MENEAKDQLLRYMSNNLVTTKGSNTPEFYQRSTSTNNLYSQLTNALGVDFVYKEVSSQANEINNTMTVYYGWDSSNKGFIALVDNQFNLIQIIRNYDSGTEFGKILIMNFDENGYYFCLEQQANNIRRIVFMNNFTVKLPTATTYSVVLRKAYSVIDEVNNVYEFNAFIKDPLESKYLLTGMVNADSITRGTPIAFQVEIVVGSTNTWNTWTYDTSVYGWNEGTFAVWDSSGNITFKIGCLQYSSGGAIYNYAEYTGTTSSTTLSQQIFTQEFTLTGSAISKNYLKTNIINLNLTYIYVIKMVSDTSSPSMQRAEPYLYQITFGTTTDTMRLIFDDHGFTGSIDYNFIKLINLGTELLFVHLNWYNGTLGYMYRQVGELETYKAPLILVDLDSGNFQDFIVNKQYNLYNIFVQGGNEVDFYQQIYNLNSYNGLTYYDINCLVPNSAIIYNNQTALFARNLSNVIVNNNVTISTLDIPNKYANDVSINSKVLLGKTNLIINNDTNIFTKNIYEELLINFTNTILIGNYNSTTPVINYLGSNRLNNSVSVTTDYSSSSIQYYRINYTDNTYVDYLLSTNSYTFMSGVYLIAFHVDKEISNIQLISGDKDTIYLTLENNNWVVGNYYSINQPFVIE